MILWLDLVLEYRYKLRVKDLVVDPPSIHPLPQWWHWSLFYLSCICIWIGYFPLWLPYQCVDNFFLEVYVYTLPNLLCNMNDNFQKRNNVQTFVAISVGTKNISVSSRINFANISYTKFNFYIYFIWRFLWQRKSMVL